MGIDVAWVEERHEPKQEVHDSRQVLTRLATSRWPELSSSVCLRFVLPWSDAVFNQAQIPELLAELRTEVSESRDAEVRAHLDKVIRLVERAVDQTHTYSSVIDAMRSNITLVPTRKGDAPLLAAQRGRWAQKALVHGSMTEKDRG